MNRPKPESPAASCAVCGGEVAPQPGAGRPRRYCSSRCKSRADRQRRKDRALSPNQQPKSSKSLLLDEQLRITRNVTREAAIELVAADPDALNEVLVRAKPIIASPTHRATRWREVAATISMLAAMIPED